MLASGVSQGVSQKDKSRKLPPFLSFLKVEFPYKDGMEEGSRGPADLGFEPTGAKRRPWVRIPYAPRRQMSRAKWRDHIRRCACTERIMWSLHFIGRMPVMKQDAEHPANRTAHATTRANARDEAECGASFESHGSFDMEPGKR